MLARIDRLMGAGKWEEADSLAAAGLEELRLRLQDDGQVVVGFQADASSDLPMRAVFGRKIPTPAGKDNYWVLPPIGFALGLADTVAWSGMIRLADVGETLTSDEGVLTVNRAEGTGEGGWSVRFPMTSATRIVEIGDWICLLDAGAREPRLGLFNRESGICYEASSCLPPVFDAIQPDRLRLVHDADSSVVGLIGRDDQCYPRWLDDGVVEAALLELRRTQCCVFTGDSGTFFDSAWAAWSLLEHNPGHAVEQLREAVTRGGLRSLELQITARQLLDDHPPADSRIELPQLELLADYDFHGRPHLVADSDGIYAWRDGTPDETNRIVVALTDELNDLPVPLDSVGSGFSQSLPRLGAALGDRVLLVGLEALETGTYGLRLLSPSPHGGNPDRLKPLLQAKLESTALDALPMELSASVAEDPGSDWCVLGLAVGARPLSMTAFRLTRLGDELYGDTLSLWPTRLGKRLFVHQARSMAELDELAAELQHQGTPPLDLVELDPGTGRELERWPLPAGCERLVAAAADRRLVYTRSGDGIDSDTLLIDGRAVELRSEPRSSNEIDSDTLFLFDPFEVKASHEVIEGLHGALPLRDWIDGTHQIWRREETFLALDFSPGVPSWRRLRWKKEIPDVSALGRSDDPELLPVLQSDGTLFLLERETGNFIGREDFPFPTAHSLLVKDGVLHGIVEGRHFAWKLKHTIDAARQPYRVLAFVLAGLIAVSLPTLVVGWIQRRARQQVALRRAEVDAEMLAAAKVQRALQPASRAALSWGWCCGETRTAWEVGGDLFEALTLPGGRIALLVGDVTGHGLDTGVMVAMARGALRGWEHDDARSGASLLGLLHELSRRHGMIRPRPLYAAALLIVDPANGDVETFLNGAPRPWLLPRGGEPVELDGSCGLPLGAGKRPNLRPFRLRLEPGDRLLLLSDGVGEQLDPAGRSLDEARPLAVARQALALQVDPVVELFVERQRRVAAGLPLEDLSGNEHLKSAVAAVKGRNPLDALFAVVDEHAAGAEQLDDRTLLLFEYVRRTEPGAKPEGLVVMEFGDGDE
ncbi:MAG: serine/threonine-protein phosphatase [Calditrichaeota bacterium]|nr:serine/threonine-protein phosphatase [Calditrichota bacterium]